MTLAVWNPWRPVAGKPPGSGCASTWPGPARAGCTAWPPAPSMGGASSIPSRLRLGLPVTILPNQQFLNERFQPLPNPLPGKRYVMEYFYRAMRQHFQLLLQPDGSPLGGKWNFDPENRQRLPASLTPPERLRFPPDTLTRQVMAEVAAWQPARGSVAGFDLAVTPAQAGQALADFLNHRLAQ